MNETLRVGMLGFGTVGQAVARALERDATRIVSRTGRPIVLRRVAVRHPSKPRPILPHGVDVHADPLEVVEQGDVDVVVEVMGGEEPAFSAIRHAIASGKPVVTANKLVMARHGPKLLQLAAERGVPLLFEAAVGGAIPIIRPIRESLASDRVVGLMGILNGTTNFILTEMTESSSTTLAQALTQAQLRGYAEADPQADISGFDAACKLAVLVSLAFDGWLAPEDVHVSGLVGVDARDIQYASELGLTIKLLAFAFLREDGVEAWVGPALVSKRHPLSQVRGINNAVVLVTQAAGDLMFYGAGAGGDPTAAAILGDVMDVARRASSGHRQEANGALPEAFVPGQRVATADPGRTVHRFYVRMQVVDRPGVLAAIAAVFGQHAVSIESVIQKGRGEDPVDLVFVTHEAPLASVEAVLHTVGRLPVVVRTGPPMRVVGG
ncbi:MAG: homoserine dehydrogenase [Bacillota bacterium]